ncbi:hypothetical protein RUND412_004250 [Rhizina undulata]
MSIKELARPLPEISPPRVRICSLISLRHPRLSAQSSSKKKLRHESIQHLTSNSFKLKLARFRFGKLEEINIEQFDWQYRVNVLGPLLLMQAVLPFLPHDQSGRVVNVSSVASSLGNTGQSIYAGTKAALEAMTRTWCNELAERATVNSVNPGPVATHMYNKTDTNFRNEVRLYLEHTPLSHYSESEQSTLSQEQLQQYKACGGRPATPDEVAGIVAMLCSADSAWCTGCVVGANGGMYFST